jgi:serine/threonine protein kinase
MGCSSSSLKSFGGISLNPPRGIQSTAEWKTEFIKLYSERKFDFAIKWHLKKNNIPDTCLPFFDHSLSLVRGILSDNVSEADQLLAISLGFGLLTEAKKCLECLKCVKRNFMVSDIQKQVIEYLTYLYGDGDDFMSIFAEELFKSTSDPKLLCAYYNHLALDEVSKLNYGGATELWLKANKYCPSNCGVVLNLIRNVYLGAPHPWFSIDKAKSLMSVTMEFARDDIVLYTILVEYFVMIFLAPEYWYVVTYREKKESISLSVRNKLISRKKTALDTAAELGYVETDFRHYKANVGELVYSVRGVDNNRDAWYMVLIDPRNRGAFLKDLKGEMIHLENHGLVLHSAYGKDVPEQIVNNVKECFDIDRNTAATHPDHVCNILVNYLNNHVSTDVKVISPAPTRRRILSIHSPIDKPSISPVKGPPSHRQMPIADSALSVISSSSIVVGKTIGQGGYGRVCRGIWKGATAVALKVLLCIDSSQEDFKRESEIHANLKHPNIIALYGVCIEPTNYILVMELMVGGSLDQFLSDTTKIFTWEQRITVALGIVGGLSYLHDRSIIHRDLKSMNILFDLNMQPKLCDFGMAKLKTSTMCMTADTMGTPCWMAPEVMEMGGRCNVSTDIFALAVVFWEIATREMPFSQAQSIVAIATFVCSGRRLPIPLDVPSGFGALILICWDHDPKKRPPVTDIIRRLRMSNVKL